MEFLKEKKQGVMIYHIQQERLDTTIAPELKADLLMTLEAGDKNILIDLAAVKYVDSSGLGALLFGLRQMRAFDGALKLLSPAPRVTKLLEIAHLIDHLLCYEDETAALQSFVQTENN